MSSRLILPALVLPLLALSACKPDVSTMRRINVPEHLLFLPLGSLDNEAQACVRHYLDTKDARYATPGHHITLLHLAAMTHRLWLVRELLAAGADPNALMSIGHEENSQEKPGSVTPALLAVMDTHGSDGENEDARLVLRDLVKAGARLNQPQGQEESILLHCKNESKYTEGDSVPSMNSGEELALELMKLGAPGGTAAAHHFIRQGWPHALAALLPTLQQEECWPETARDLMACCVASVSGRECDFSGKKDIVGCAKLLLQAEPALLDEPDAEGNTPLFLLAQAVPEHCANRYGMKTSHSSSSSSSSCTICEARHHFIALLLNRGADPLKPC